MKFDILNRLTGAVQFTAEIDCDDDDYRSVKVGLAVMWAAKNKADLSEANLRGADLRGADLSGADLSLTDMSRAYLSEADLRGADLSGADLRGANLSLANLRGADLREAYLSRAYLSGADLREACMSGAYLSLANLCGAKDIPPLAAAQSNITPDGQIVGWKKCLGGVLVKLSIPTEARRSNATGRKCRAEYADCIEVIGSDVGTSRHDGKTTYRVGERIACDNWCEDRWQECAGGIHFFLTREEAEAY